MDEIELVKALSDHDHRIKSLQHRMDEVESLTEEIRDLTRTMAELTVEMQHTNHSVAEIKNKMDALEQVPKGRYNQIIAAVISALVGGVIAYAITIILH